MSSPASRADLGLVVALFNEQECVEEFVRQVRAALDEQAIQYEIVFVDDGSTDRTVSIVGAMTDDDPRIKLVQLSRNHGKEAAVTAGIAHASARCVLMMDPDLQDPPDAIMEFYQTLESGPYDLVFGVRIDRAEPWLDRFSAQLFWRGLNALTGLQIPHNLSVMRIFNRQFRQEFLRYGERVRFIEGIFMSVGLRRTTLPVENRARHAGVSKFTLRRKLRLAVNAITAFSERPLELAIGLGGILLAATVAFGSWAFLRKLVLGVGLLGWTSTIVAVLFMGSLQLVLLGVIGKYLGNLYREAKARPIYTIQATWNVESTDLEA